MMAICSARIRLALLAALLVLAGLIFAQRDAPAAAAQPVVAAAPPAQSVIDNSAFVAETLADGTVLAPGAAFEKSWTLLNNGYTTWGPGYRFVFTGGELLARGSRFTFSGSVPPGATVTLSLPMDAPDQAGSYTSKWRLQNAEGKAFGAQVWVTISVVEPTQTICGQLVWAPVGPCGSSESSGAAQAYPILVSCDGKSAYLWNVASFTLGQRVRVPEAVLGDIAPLCSDAVEGQITSQIVRSGQPEPIASCADCGLPEWPPADACWVSECAPSAVLFADDLFGRGTPPRSGCFAYVDAQEEWLLGGDVPTSPLLDPLRRIPDLGDLVDLVPPVQYDMWADEIVRASQGQQTYQDAAWAILVDLTLQDGGKVVNGVLNYQGLRLTQTQALGDPAIAPILSEIGQLALENAAGWEAWLSAGRAWQYADLPHDIYTRAVTSYPNYAEFLKAYPQAHQYLDKAQVLFCPLPTFASSGFEDGDDAGWSPISGQWEAEGGVYRQPIASALPSRSMASVADASWYTLDLDARSTGGREGFLVIFKFQGKHVWWNIGGWSNTASRLEGVANTMETRTGDRVTRDRWYRVRIAVEGDTATGWLDGVQRWRITRSPAQVPGLLDDSYRGTGLTGLVGVGTWSSAAEFDNVLVTIQAAPPPTPTPAPTRTPLPTRTPVVILAPTSTRSFPAPDAVVNSAALNMRSGPGIAYPILGSYARGTALGVLGRSAAADWLQVQGPDGRIGWMATSLLRLNISLAGVRVVGAPPPPATPTPRPTSTPVIVWTVSPTFSPTWTRTASPTSPPTATRTPAPTSTPTRTPTPTNPPIVLVTATASPTATPTFTSVPATCSIPVEGEFQPVWSLAGGIAAGCPTGGLYQRRMGYQPFQNGFMLWRAGNAGDAGGAIYVFMNTGSWQVYADTWLEGMPETGGLTPPAGLIEPRRGFGKLWREVLGGPSSAIGWALQDEAGSDSGHIQDFGGGAAILRFPGQSPVFAPAGRNWVR